MLNHLNTGSHSRNRSIKFTLKNTRTDEEEAEERNTTGSSIQFQRHKTPKKD